MNDAEGHNQGELPIAALLRMAADGELSAEQESRLRAHLAAHPEDERRVDFERELRGACARACCPDCCAPAGLRERVMACCDEDTVAEGLASRAPETRDRSFWARRMVLRFGAVAALIALVALMSFMVGRSAAPTTPEGWIQRVASFTRKEHGRCAEMPAAENSKFTVERADQLEPEFAILAGREVSLGTVLEAADKGLQFLDAGECHLPGGGTAMHIRFQTDDPTAGVVSVWAQVDGSLELDEGKTYVSGEGCDCVRLWRVGEVRYVMVCSSEESAPAAGGAFGCPLTTQVCEGR